MRLLPTPRATDGTKGGPNQRGSSGDLMLPSAVALLPTPKANDHTGAGVHGTGGLDLPTAALLATPQARDWRGIPGDGYNTASLPRDVANTGACGKYTQAIARWETILGRPAPGPTTPGKNNPQLSARFVEWMMGLPDGWVTRHGLTRAQALKVLGNGVVPQQAAAATRLWGGRP